MEIKSIFVLRAGAIGDLIFSLPSLRALREKFPHAYIEMASYPYILELVKERYYVQRIRSIEERGISKLYWKNVRIEELREELESFDLFIAWTYDREGVLATNLRRAGVKYVLIADPFPPVGLKRHIGDYLLDTLSPLQLRVKEIKPKLFLSEDDRRYASSFWKEKGLEGEDNEITVAIHPGSGGRKKVWFPDRFAQVADLLVERYGARILLIWGPADGEIVPEVIQGMQKAKPLIVKDIPLTKLAAILQRCDSFLGNDSGITHISAAVGTPTLALFGPTEAEVWGPRGEMISILQKEIGCRPCSQEELASCSTRRCLELIKVEEVFSRVETLLPKSDLIEKTIDL